MYRFAPSLVFAALVLSAGCTGAPAPERAAASESKAETAPDQVLFAGGSARLDSPPPDAEKSASGLVSKLLKPGSGDKRPQLHDKVRVHFSAWNAKGKLVDGSEQRGGPVTFEMTGVIAGWTEALQAMRVGERRRLWIPDDLVYPGRAGYPRAAALFELELLEIIDGKPPLPAPEDVAAAPPESIKTHSGLAYKLLTSPLARPRTRFDKAQGNENPRPWDKVTIHFTGWTADGVMFASSRNQEQPSVFEIAKVMPGWREALPLLSVGDRARLWLPEALAYQGRVGEPRGNLVFDIELLSIQRQPEPPRAPADVAAIPRGVTRTQSGLAHRLLRAGSGTTKPKATDRVQMHYSAWTTDGELFDSSVVRGKPASVPLDRLIPGLTEGLQLMTEGAKARLWIPEKLAYAGRDGAPTGMLVYEVELLKIAP